MRQMFARQMLALTTAIAVTTIAVPAEAKECKTIAAAGSGLTQGIAEIMAKGGVKTLIDSRGLTAVGEPKVKCNSGTVMTECHAHQKACK